MGLSALAVATMGYCLLGKRLERTILTAPMLFLALGVGLHATGLLELAHGEEVLYLVAEIALVLLLFLDAAQTDLRALRRDHSWPLRMLLLGLPLAVVLGGIAVHLILPGWPLVVALLAAALLAPTDAALGQAVVTNPALPLRTRRTLVVESGLNDGLALPLILLLATVAGSMMAPDGLHWAAFGAKQILLGPLVGVAMGWVGGKLLIRAKDAGTTGRAYEGVGAVALALGSYLMATQIDGNGFIAAFTAGLAFGHVVQKRCPFVYEFTENDGQMLAWGAFFLLGLTLVPDAVAGLGPREAAVIAVSLCIVRPVAIWLSLIGTDAAPMSRLFFGWFGPRGLATALFALLVVPEIGPRWGEEVLHLAVNAVWISALVHGVTAAPAARLFASRLSRMGDCAETQAVTASARPLRGHPG